MSSAPAAAPLLPRDARLIALLLAANGAEDCEEGVVRMLVEFAHRYTSDILSDSLVYAEHAKQGTGASTANLVPSLEDVRLAVQARTEGGSVPKEFLLQLATQVNATPLPPVPEVYGIRLPPPAARLTAPNFSLIPRSAAPPPPPNPSTPGASGLQDFGGADGGGATTGGEESDSDDGALFGDDDDDDDEEMEDVTAGLFDGANGAGEKRKAESDEEYD
ncbi:hypothetical protein RQP46_005397 [Phenoliferia psychrophenolica]